MSSMQGVILYGPPAAGKDTVTTALTELSPNYTLLPRLKIGAGKSAGYRMGTREQLLELEAAGDVLYANARYGNTYVIDRPAVHYAFAAGMPVVHLGQTDGIRALVGGYPADWLVVLLWCSRQVAKQRSIERGDSDTTSRLVAWDATRKDLAEHPGITWHLTLNTAAVSPQDAARSIDRNRRERASKNRVQWTSDPT